MNPVDMRAQRIFWVLTQHPDHGITRQRLATTVRDPKRREPLVCTPGMVTAALPYVSARLAELDLHLVRPSKRNRYRVAASTFPAEALLTAMDREQHILTRLVNDYETGRTNHLLLTTGTPDMARQIQRMIDRSDDFIASVRRRAADAEAVYDAALGILAEMPDMPTLRVPTRVGR